MVVKKEFIVNEYITLKLEGDKTVIYFAGERFRQCKFLLLEIPVEKSSSFDQIASIDDIAEKLDYFSEPINKRISPEVEFWAHCSNIQVWAESGYNTRLLHSNLSFPLLKKLVDISDAKAKRVFKEEIAKRFIYGNKTTMTYLIEEGYLKFLNDDEFESMLNDSERNSIIDYFEYVMRGSFNVEELFPYLEKLPIKILILNTKIDFIKFFINDQINYSISGIDYLFEWINNKDPTVLKEKASLMLKECTTRGFNYFIFFLADYMEEEEFEELIEKSNLDSIKSSILQFIGKVAENDDEFGAINYLLNLKHSKILLNNSKLNLRDTIKDKLKGLYDGDINEYIECRKNYRTLS